MLIDADKHSGNVLWVSVCRALGAAWQGRTLPVTSLVVVSAAVIAIGVGVRDTASAGITILAVGINTLSFDIVVCNRM